MKITITPRGFTRNGQEYIKLLQQKGFEVDFNDTGKSYNKEQFLEHCQGADAVICAVEKVDKEFIDQCPELKAVIKFGVGIDNIDVDYCASKGIFTGRCAGSNSRSVAEHALTLMLTCTKNIYEGIDATKHRNWIKLSGFEIYGKTLGIVGFGAIGKQLSSMASALGMRVLCYDTFPVKAIDAEAQGAWVSDLETLYKEADFISVHVPLNEETKSMISLKEMKMMKPDCVLINTARGGIIDEDDLYTALSEHVIKAACFDVFSSEPPKEGEKLLGLENFYLTPHMAASTKEADVNCCRMATDIALKQLTGTGL